MISAHPIPCTYAGRILARKLDGIVRPDTETIIAEPNRITYDWAVTEPGVVMQGADTIPTDRVIASAGVQVRLQACKHHALCRIDVWAVGDVRLHVGEGIHFGPCA